MCLKTKVMVVNLNISQWTARKYDAGASREVEQNHGATDAGRFNKILIANDSLKKIQKVAGSARTYHYFNTLPWGDNGDRILPTANYFNYVSEIGKFKSDFDTLVSDFVSLYPALKEEARMRLNTLFSESDYPMPGQIERKFDLRISFMPVSDGDDLRVNISQEEIERIKSEINGAISDRVTGAVTEMLSRIREAVSHVADTLEIPDKIFRDSLIGNVCSLIETIPLLNFDNDKHVNEVVDLIRPLCVDPEQLRNNQEFRKEIALKAKFVLNLI